MTCRRPSHFLSLFAFFGVLALLSACEEAGSVGEAGAGGAGPSDKRPGALGGAGGGAGADAEAPTEKPGPVDCAVNQQGFATEVVASEFGEGQDFGREDFPEAVLGGPLGGGCCSGALDVTSLGDGGVVTLGFGERTIIDGPGPDFIVFENAFWAGGDPDLPVAELGRVAVSADGSKWSEFPCEDLGGPTYGSCAGWRPVLANVIDDEIDPFDPEEAGGDPFDLADIGVEEARYVRITDLAGDDVVFDLDAVSVVNARCEEK